MKRLSIFLAAMMACTMSFAVDFKKVTTAPADWSGEYLLVYENSEAEVFVWNGVDAEAAYDKMTIADGKITATASTVTIKIASMDGGYSLSLNGGTNNGKYVGMQNDKNGFVLNASALVNTIAKTEEGVDIVSAKAHIRFNNATTNGNRFRYYKSASYTKQQPVQLYKKVAGVEIPATAIALDQTALELKQYESATLKATLTPADATTDVVWESSDEKVATVANGVVTAVGEGKATITAAAGKLTATCAVTVKAVTLMTIKDANAAAEGATVALNPVTVTYIYQANGYVYIMDETGYALLHAGYNNKLADKVKAGDVLSNVVGKKTYYNKLPQINIKDVDPAAWTITEGTAPAPIEFNTIPTEEDINKYIVIRGIEYKGEGFTFDDNDNRNLTVDYAGGKLNLRNEFKLKDLTLESGKTYDIYGGWSKFKESLQLNISEIKAASSTAVEEVKAETGKAVKVVENGQLIIIRDGVRYNAVGAVME